MICVWLNIQARYPFELEIDNNDVQKAIAESGHILEVVSGKLDDCHMTIGTVRFVKPPTHGLS